MWKNIGIFVVLIVLLMISLKSIPPLSPTPTPGPIPKTSVVSVTNTPTNELSPTPNVTPTISVVSTPTVSPTDQDQAHLLCWTHVKDEESQYYEESLTKYYPNLVNLPEDVVNLMHYLNPDIQTRGCNGENGQRSNLSTVLSTTQNEQSQITFVVPGHLSNRVFRKIWVIMTADNTTLSDPQEAIGKIRFLKNNGTSEERLIKLGDNIADWSYRNETDILPVTRVGSQVRYLYFDLEGGNGRPYRATQLLATEFLIDEHDQIEEITIIDTSINTTLNVIAIMLDPSTSSLLLDNTKFKTICIDNTYFRTNITRSGKDLFLQFYQGGFNSSENITRNLPRIRNKNFVLGCEHNNAMPFPKSIPFSISKILEVRSTSVGDEDFSTMEVTISNFNEIRSKYVYFFISARNICYQSAILRDNPLIGKIKINNDTPIDLVVGENIRQGRTNFESCGQNLNYMQISPSGYHNNLESLPGIPFPVMPDVNETNNKHAELWLDIIKIQLPENIGEQINISISVRNRLTTDQEIDSVFITLYAITFEGI